MIINLKLKTVLKMIKIIIFIVILLFHFSFAFSQLGLPIGSKAKNFVQTDTSNQIVSLESYKGKYVLLEFWASWCIPCRNENPNLVKAYNQFHSKGLEIVAVSLDISKEEWTKAIIKDKLPWIHVSDLKGLENTIAKEYNISAVPYNLLINPDGVIIAKLLKKERLFQKLNEIYKK